MTVPAGVRPVLLALVILTITVAHHATDPVRIWWHVAYQDLAYVPILVGAYWFGVAGGLAMAAVAAVGTVVHFQTMWHGNAPFVISEYGQAIGFMITGTVGGILATAERRATRRHQAARAALERAHTELQASHEHLVRADRLSSLGEIAAGLAHELGNPLAGVKGALEIITSRAAPESPEAEFSGLASREITRLEGLIEEFLRFARPHEPRRHEADIFDVLDRVVSLIGREAQDHGVSIHVTRTPAPHIWIDTEQMVQVFVNIVLNAIQVSPTGSRVELAPSASHGMLAVEVRDEGPGIPAEHLERIFDPFFSTKKRGTGLGLSISSRIVQSHGGRIEVEQPGHGTVVRVLMPLMTAERGVAGRKPVDTRV